MKTCKSCKIEKETASFSADKRNRDGLQGECNDCRRAYKEQLRKSRMGIEITIQSKCCNKCNQTKDSSEFYRDAGIIDGLSTICKDCKNETTQSWRQDNRLTYNSHQRAYNKANYQKLRIQRYDLTVDQYNKLLKDQDSKCLLCAKPPSENRPLAIDHDHVTNKVRGLLCYNCNRGMHFVDRDDLLAKMIEYRNKHR